MKMRLKDKVSSLLAIAILIFAVILCVSALFVTYPIYIENNTNLHTGICVSVKTEYSPSLNRTNSDYITIITLEDETRFF